MKKNKKPPVQQSVSKISKEKIKAKNKKTTRIVVLIFYLFAVAYALNVSYIMSSNPRMTLDMATSEAFTIMFQSIEAYKHINTDHLLYIFVATMAAFFVNIIVKSNRELRKHDNPETVNGDAKFMDKADLDEYNKRRTEPIGQSICSGEKNMILSKELYLSLDGKATKRNCNILVIGGSGAGKSRYFAAPNILQFNSNFVITDPSGELLRDYGKVLENNGYKVKVFNLVDVSRSNSYNPFHYIKEEKDVFVLVNTLIKNTTGEKSKAGDPFWEKCEKLLLQALFLYLWHTVSEKDQTMENVMKLIDMASVDENDASAQSNLDKLFENLEKEDPDNLAAVEYRNFKKAAGKTLKSIIISVVARMESFMLSDIKHLTRKDDFEFESFADTKQALFVIIPTADTTFNFLVSLLYAQLFMTLYEYVEKRAGFGYMVYCGTTSIKVVQAKTKADSEKAKAEAETLAKEIKKGLCVEHDEEKDLYYIYTQETHRLVSWRGTDESAQAWIKELTKNVSVRKCANECPNHVRFILDEFANIGQIPDFNEKLATIRKYSISCSIILQALSQLKTMYKEQFETIIGNCDTKIYLGGNDTETMKWISELLGKRTTIVENTSYQGNGNGSTSYNKSSIELMSVNQLALMKDDECIVMVRGERPYFGIKYDLLSHPKFKDASETSGAFVIPHSEWKSLSNIPLRLRRNKNAEDAAKNAETDDAEQPNPTHKKNTSPDTATPANGTPHKTPPKPQTTTHEQMSANTTESPFKTNQTTPKEKGTQTDKRKQEHTQAKNASRKDRAKKFSEAAANFDEHASDNQEELVQNLVDELGITPTSTPQQIKEVAVTLIDLPEIPKNSPNFSETD